MEIKRLNIQIKLEKGLAWPNNDSEAYEASTPVIWTHLSEISVHLGSRKVLRAAVVEGGCIIYQRNEKQINIRLLISNTRFRKTTKPHI